LLLVLWFGVTVVWPFATVLAQAGGGRQVWQTLRGHADWLVYSCVLGLVAALLATGIAFFLGQLLAGKRTFWVRCLDTCCWLPIAWPGTVLGLAFLRLGSAIPWLQRESWGVLLLLAYVGLFSAFAVRVFYAGFSRVDPHVTDAAALDCRHWFQRFWTVDAYRMAPCMGVSLMLVFVLVVGELNATVLLVPPGKTTLAVSIDNLLHYGASATASALCLLEAALVVTVVVLAWGWIRVCRRCWPRPWDGNDDRR
jgi:iron(III) transport system permease protein